MPAPWWVELGLVPLVGRAMSIGVFRGSCRLRKTSISWLVGLCSSPVGCWASGVPGLEPTGCWVGPSLGVKMVASRRAHSNGCPLVPPPLVCSSPERATATTHFPRDKRQRQCVTCGDPLKPWPIGGHHGRVPGLSRFSNSHFEGISKQVAPVELDVYPVDTILTGDGASHFVFSGSQCARDLVCTFQECILFQPVLQSSSDKALLAFKDKCSVGSSSWLMPDPRLGSLMWGSEFLLLWEKLCNIISFQFVGCPPSRHWIWLYQECTPPSLLLWLLLCLWM